MRQGNWAGRTGAEGVTLCRTVRDDFSEKLGKSWGYLWEGVQGRKLVSAKALGLGT